MSKEHPSSNLQMIPIDKIEVLNPRDRNGRIFDDIVGNIKNIGLKKPITVTPSASVVTVRAVQAAESPVSCARVTDVVAAPWPGRRETDAEHSHQAVGTPYAESPRSDSSFHDGVSSMT